VVLLMVSATLDGDEVKPRIENVELLDAAALRQRQDLRVFIRDEGPLSALSERLRQSGDAKVSVVVIVDGGEEEIEIELPGKRLVSPQIASALQAAPGVVGVELH
jgi:DNA polymerase-3 subunit alpha